MKNKSFEKILNAYPIMKRRFLVINNWDEKKTLKQNANDNGIDFQSCYVIAKKFKLNYISGIRGKVRDDDKIQLVNGMRSKGMTYKAIGDLIGVSRQRVHQIIKGE